jgi:hypothetical protein
VIDRQHAVIDAAGDHDPAGPREPGINPDSVRIEGAVPGAL